MTESAPRRSRRRWIIAVTSVVGGLVVLGGVGEVVLRGIIDDRIENTASDLPELEVTPRSGSLVAQVPLPVGGTEETVDVLLSVAAEGGRAVLRAESVRFAGLSLPVTAVADQLGITQLDRLADGVTFPEGESQVAISSARATEEGLELGAEVAMW